MSLMALLSGLLKEFYSSRLSYFPILDSNSSQVESKNNEQAKLIGFLSRKSLSLWAADIKRLNREYKRIPPELLNNSLSSTELLQALPANEAIPVLDNRGLKVALWDEDQFIEALGKFSKNSKKTSKKTSSKTLSSKKAIPQENRQLADNSRWLAGLLIGSIPWPLYACDINGRVLFFNELFEKKILSKTKAKNSLRYMEDYLIELVQKLLAKSFTDYPENQSDLDLSTHDSSLGHSIRIISIKERESVYSYFFIFQEENDPTFTSEINRRLSSGKALKGIINEIEGRTIFSALKRNGDNISHTAKALKIKRSTLQNKINYLNISKKFGNIGTGIIHRNRR